MRKDESRQRGPMTMEEKLAAWRKKKREQQMKLRGSLESKRSSNGGGKKSDSRKKSSFPSTTPSSRVLQPLKQSVNQENKKDHDPAVKRIRKFSDSSSKENQEKPLHKRNWMNINSKTRPSLISVATSPLKFKGSNSMEEELRPHHFHELGVQTFLDTAEKYCQVGNRPVEMVDRECQASSPVPLLVSVSSQTIKHDCVEIGVQTDDTERNENCDSAHVLPEDYEAAIHFLHEVHDQQIKELMLQQEEELRIREENFLRQVNELRVALQTGLVQSVEKIRALESELATCKAQLETSKTL